MKQYTSPMVEIIVLHRLGHTEEQIQERFSELGLPPPPVRKIRDIAGGHSAWIVEKEKVVEARQRHSAEVREKQERLEQENAAKRERQAMQRGKPYHERATMAGL